MNYDIDAYEAAVNEWFKELKDIVASDLLRQHISKYPEKRDYEIEALCADGHKEQDEDSSNSSCEKRS